MTFFDFNFNEHKETYVGLTATEFKDRHRNHKTSLEKLLKFNNPKGMVKKKNYESLDICPNWVYSTYQEP